MKANRRFKIFIIWLIEVDLLVIGRAVFPSRVEGDLVLKIVELCTYMAGLVILGLSGTHMVYDWANGKLKKKKSPELAESAK